MNRLELFKILMLMAAADGKFSSEEIELLALRSHRWGLSDEQFSEALAYAKGGATELCLPEQQEDRERLLRDLLEVMAADGEIDPKEKRLYALVAAAMGFDAQAVDQKIKQWL